MQNVWTVKKNFNYSIGDTPVGTEYQIGDEYPYNPDRPIDVLLADSGFISCERITKYKIGDWVKHVCGEIFLINDIDDSIEKPRYYGTNLYNTMNFECNEENIECKMQLTTKYAGVWKRPEYIGYKYSLTELYNSEQEVINTKGQYVTIVPIYIFEKEN